MERLAALFEHPGEVEREEITLALAALRQDYTDRAIELVEVASGFRVQVRKELAPWVGRLWAEKAPRYSRALLETLALIAYRQPVTRGDIEEVRGVAVSTHIMRTLSERGWVRVVGHRDVPGRPALYATTRNFLDYFNLESLADLPSLLQVETLSSQDEQPEETDRMPNHEAQTPSQDSGTSPN